VVGVAGNPAHSTKIRWASVSHPLPQQDTETTYDILLQHGYVPAKEQPHKPKEAYLYHCMFHDDRRPSFALHADKNQWKCWICGGGGPRQFKERLGVGYNPVPKMPRALKAPKRKRATEAPEYHEGCTVEKLAELKGLPLEYLQDTLRWFNTTYRYSLSEDGPWVTCDAVGMPYPSAVQLRIALTEKDRFRWQQAGCPGNSKELYGLEWLRPIDKTVLLVEGTTDVAVGLLMFVPTVGIPGAGQWNKEKGRKWAEQLAGRDVVVWQEPGPGGRKLVEDVAHDIPNLRVIQAPPGIKDVCELFNQAGAGAGDMLRELMADAQPYYPASDEEDVPNRERTKKVLFPIRDRSALWESAKELFPLPTGTKPWTVGRLLYNKRDGKAVVCDFLSNSWRNPANAQHKRRCLLFNILPRINGTQVYEMKVPFDDWTPQLHETIRKRIQRAMTKSGDEGLGWIWFDNIMERGYCLYLTNAPGVSGFEAVEDVEATLVGALKAIHPPGKEEPGRFRPYGGSDSWTSRVEGTGEQDKGKWDIIAVSDSPTDFVQFEAECIVSNIPHEATKPYWRAQVGDGLEMRMPFKGAVLLASSLGYSLTNQGRAGLGDSAEDTSTSAEQVKAFTETWCSPEAPGPGRVVVRI